MKVADITAGDHVKFSRSSLPVEVKNIKLKESSLTLSTSLKSDLDNWGTCRLTQLSAVGTYALSICYIKSGLLVTLDHWQESPVNELWELTEIKSKVVPNVTLAINLLLHWYDIEQDSGLSGHNQQKTGVVSVGGFNHSSI